MNRRHFLKSSALAAAATASTDALLLCTTRRTPDPTPYAGYNPTNVAFSPDGSFYVGDGYGSNRIHKYDKAGTLVNSFGGTGSKDGQFKTPHGLWVDNRDKTRPVLVVCDRANARLQW